MLINLETDLFRLSGAVGQCTMFMRFSECKIITVRIVGFLTWLLLSLLV